MPQLRDNENNPIYINAVFLPVMYQNDLHILPHTEQI